MIPRLWSPIPKSRAQGTWFARQGRLVATAGNASSCASSTKRLSLVALEMAQPIMDVSVLGISAKADLCVLIRTYLLEDIGQSGISLQVSCSSAKDVPSDAGSPNARGFRPRKCLRIAAHVRSQATRRRNFSHEEKADKEHRWHFGAHAVHIASGDAGGHKYLPGRGVEFKAPIGYRLHGVAVW